MVHAPAECSILHLQLSPEKNPTPTEHKCLYQLEQIHQNELVRCGLPEYLHACGQSGELKFFQQFLGNVGVFYSLLK